MCFTKNTPWRKLGHKSIFLWLQLFFIRKAIPNSVLFQWLFTLASQTKTAWFFVTGRHGAAATIVLCPLQIQLTFWPRVSLIKNDPTSHFLVWIYKSTCDRAQNFGVRLVLAWSIAWHLSRGLSLKYTISLVSFEISIPTKPRFSEWKAFCLAFFSGGGIHSIHRQMHVDTVFQ